MYARRVIPIDDDDDDDTQYDISRHQKMDILLL